MRKETFAIPDHSAAAISEAYEAALFAAAFKKMEDEEMKLLKANIMQRSPQASDAGFERRIQMRIRARKAGAILKYKLPRVAQVAACFVGVVALGMGVTFAASESARNWAAGVLVGESYEDTFFEETVTTSFTEGTVIDDTLCLLGGQSGSQISLRSATDAEPVTYELKNATGNETICELENYNGEVCIVCYDGTAASEAERDLIIGRAVFASDGTYTIEAAAVIEHDAYANPEEMLYTEGMALRGGKAYISIYAYDNSSFFERGPSRLLAYDAAAKTLSELDVPQYAQAMLGESTLFGGEEGMFYAMIDDAAKVTRLMRIEENDALTHIADIPYEGQSYASSFAWNEKTNTLYYHYNGSIYAAKDFDIANAQRVAVTVAGGGEGLLLGDSSYALVNEEVSIFDVSQVQTGLTELVIDEYNVHAKEAFAGAHPDVVLIASSDWVDSDGDMTRVIEERDSTTDLWRLRQNDVKEFIDAGYAAPIEDEKIAAYIEKLYPGIQDYVMRDGKIYAVPLKVWSYMDMSIDREVWHALGYADQQLPDTWMDFLNLVCEISQSERAADFCLMAENNHDCRDQLFNKMIYSYLRSCEASGAEPDFTGSEFTAMLDAFNRIEFDRFRAYVEEGENRCLLRSGYDFGFIDPEEQLPVLLKFSEDDPAAVRATGYFMLINPDSEQQALATEYIRNELEYLEPAELYMTDAATPAAELAAGSVRITEEDVEFYRGIVRDVQIEIDPHSFESKNEAYACSEAYLCGEITQEALLSALNEIF